MSVKFTKTLDLNSGASIVVEYGPNGGKKLTVNKAELSLTVPLTADEYAALKAEL